MLKLVGVVLLVALILVGALLPLKYTARMQVPKAPRPKPGRDVSLRAEENARDD